MTSPTNGYTLRPDAIDILVRVPGELSFLPSGEKTSVFLLTGVVIFCFTYFSNKGIKALIFRLWRAFQITEFVKNNRLNNLRNSRTLACPFGTNHPDVVVDLNVLYSLVISNSKTKSNIYVFSYPARTLLYLRVTE